MLELSSGPVPNEQVLTGISANPPSLTGDLIFGILAAWADPSGQIYLASSQGNPAYQPHVVNASWKTSATPAVALALDWGRVYLAWTDASGVHLANSGDGWGRDMVIPAPVNPEAGPALAFSGELLYIIWQGSDEWLGIATCDFAGNIQWHSTETPVLSGPSLTWSNGNLYVLSGGSPDHSNDQTVHIYVSNDGGESFNYVPSQKTTSIGAPSLAIVDNSYYLVWADGDTSLLCATVTQNLESYTVTNYTDGCHNGGPALLLLPDGLVVGWSFGAPPNDPRSHHITLGQLALSAQQVEEEIKAYIQRVPTAPNPCPDPLTVYDPAENKCVPKGGCAGRCVLSSITLVSHFPVFNPIKYAICVVNCKSS
jgi:hypothetical protein